jgi:hypothetical protein
LIDALTPQQVASITGYSFILDALSVAGILEIGITLPKSITRAIGDAEYFDVKVEGGQIILTPVKIQRADAVRAKLAALELSEQDIADAVDWARKR